MKLTRSVNAAKNKFKISALVKEKGEVIAHSLFTIHDDVSGLHTLTYYAMPKIFTRLNANVDKSLLEKMQSLLKTKCLNVQEDGSKPNTVSVEPRKEIAVNLESLKTAKHCIFDALQICEKDTANEYLQTGLLTLHEEQKNDKKPFVLHTPNQALFALTTNANNSQQLQVFALDASSNKVSHFVQLSTGTTLKLNYQKSQKRCFDEIKTEQCYWKNRQQLLQCHTAMCTDCLMLNQKQKSRLQHFNHFDVASTPADSTFPAVITVFM